MSSCTFCKHRDPRWLDELGLCGDCAPPLRRFLAATLRAIDHSTELFQPSAVFPTRLSRLEVFVKRFFASQFKRSALPNGPKVSAGGTMSPRGDWRMPSDAAPTAWLAQLESVPKA